MNELTCKSFVEFLDDYRAGALTPERRAEFVSHLAICRHCRDYLRTYEDAIKLGRESLHDDGAPVPPEVPAALVNAVLSAIRKPPAG